jgi:hypothetical protein
MAQQCGSEDFKKSPTQRESKGHRVERIVFRVGYALMTASVLMVILGVFVASRHVKPGDGQYGKCHCPSDSPISGIAYPGTKNTRQ